uniref:Protein TIFY n=1 Tax=Ananas comosus var. bracteatus TaxID=296719 RepID=A0A6V7NYB8_ANACO|nr:unnamed protein product [Ananas comosus var. bracteatus]
MERGRTIMAVAMMGAGGDDDESNAKRNKNPIFHDFLGMSGEDAMLPPPSSWTKSAGRRRRRRRRLRSRRRLLPAGKKFFLSRVVEPFFLCDLVERHGGNNSEVFHFHGRKTALPGVEVCKTFSGRKRNNSDSAYTSLIKDRMLPLGSDSLESSRIHKAFGKEFVGEQSRRSCVDEITFSMQPPQRPSSLILSPNFRCDRSVPMSSGKLIHYPSRFGQNRACGDKVSSPYTYRDANSMGATIVSQPAADEGSRTGIKGSGVLKITDPGSQAGDRSITMLLPSSTTLKIAKTLQPESSNSPSHHLKTSGGRQMTIFYAGQAHVFDNVHPNKADVIMALAGSSGSSWSTTYALGSEARPSAGEAKVPGGEVEVQANSLLPSTHGHLEPACIQVPPTPGVLHGSMPPIPASEPNKESKTDV